MKIEITQPERVYAFREKDETAIKLELGSYSTDISVSISLTQAQSLVMILNILLKLPEDDKKDTD